MMLWISKPATYLAGRGVSAGRALVGGVDRTADQDRARLLAAGDSGCLTARFGARFLFAGPIALRTT
jgi:hypothetical protein